MICSLCAALSSPGAFFAPAGAKIVIFCLFFSFAVLFLSMSFLRPEKRTVRLSLFVLFTLCGLSVLSSYLFFDAKITSYEKYYGTHTVTARITESGYRNGASAKLLSVDGEQVGIKAFLTSEDYINLPAGTVITSDADICPLGDSSFEDYVFCRADGIFIRAKISDVNIIGEYDNFILTINKYCASVFYRHCKNGDILSCVFAGNRSAVPDEISASFRRLGISHMLAVSGLHITALLAGAELLLRTVFGKRRWLFFLLAALAVLYAFMTGLSGSVIRAAVMYTVMRGGVLLSARGDSPTSLCVAAAGIFIACPYAFFDVGLVLSFSATAGIVFIGSPANKYLAELITKKVTFKPLSKALVYLSSGICVTVSALIFTTPASAAYFGLLVPQAIFYNLIFSVFISLILYLSPVLVLFSPILFLSSAVGWVCDGICGVMLRLISLCTETAGAPVSLRMPFVAPLMLIALAVFTVLFIINKINIKSALALCTGFIVCFTFCQLINLSVLRTDSEAIYYRTGKGEYVCYISNNRAVLIDCSDGYTDSAEIFDRLLSKGIASVDALIITNREAQPGAVVRLCSDFHIKTVLLPERGKEPYTFGLIMSLCKNAENYNFNRGYSYQLGESRIEMFPVGSSAAFIFRNTAYCPGMPASALDFLNSLPEETVLICGGADEYDFYPVYTSHLIIPEAVVNFFTDYDFSEHDIEIYEKITVIENQYS